MDQIPAGVGACSAAIALMCGFIARDVMDTFTEWFIEVDPLDDIDE